MNPTPSFAAILQRFFTQRLIQQRQASPHTVSSYRDTFRLLFRFIQERSHKPPTQVAFEEVDAPLISAFLDDMEELVASRRAAGTCDSPPSAPSSTSLPSSDLTVPAKSNVFSPCRARDLRAR